MYGNEVALVVIIFGPLAASAAAAAAAGTSGGKDSGPELPDETACNHAASV